MVKESADVAPPLSGILERFSKQRSAFPQPTTFFLAKQFYADAIEYTGSPVGSRGLLLFVTAVTATVGLWGSQDILFNVVDYEAMELVDLVGILSATIFICVSLYLLGLGSRLELFRPFDEPTIFDRKNRKVYRNYREASLHWRGLLRRWPCKTDSYEWDNVHAEHHATVNANSATVSRAHSLVFIVQKSSDDPTVVAQFGIGGIQMGEVSVPAVWEHIRQFMEESGPHVPAGEPLLQIKPPTSFWQILSDMGPYGKSLGTWWRVQKVMTISAYLFAPILVPGCIVLAICTWLSYKTAVPLDWPQDVLNAVGQPISQS